MTAGIWFALAERACKWGRCNGSVIGGRCNRCGSLSALAVGGVL